MFERIKILWKDLGVRGKLAQKIFQKYMEHTPRLFVSLGSR